MVSVQSGVIAAAVPAEYGASILKNKPLSVALFNGSNDYLTASGRLMPYDESQPFTICWWQHPASGSANEYGTVFAEGDAGATQPTMEIWYNNNTGPHPQFNYLNWYRSSPTFIWVQYTDDGITTPYDTWHHVAMITSGASLFGLHVDGVNKTFDRFTSVPIGVRVADGNTYVGATNDGSTGLQLFWQGKIADLRIYNSQLTTSNTSAIFNGGVVGYVPIGSPLHWWKFNDGSGTSAADSGSSPTSLGWNGSGTHWSIP